MSLKFPIYLDNQATTPPDPRALAAMQPYLTEKFGNPHSTTHRFGWEAAAAVDVARAKVAKLIGAPPRDVLFLSGATEANNLAIKGIAETFAGRKARIVTPVTEHKCVLESAKACEKWGYEVTLLPVRRDGLVDLKALEAALGQDVALVSVMAVNNEIGVIQPIAEIGRIARAKGVLFHCDAAQAFGKIPLDTAAMHVDLMSLSGHKIYGPKGVGALSVRKEVRRLVTPQMAGGGQEAGIRSGTLAPALCAGFGKAAEIAAAEMAGEARRMETMFKSFVKTLTASGIEFTLNGSLEKRWFGNLNVTLPGANGDLLLAELKNLALSSGAACASATEGPSYVLEALGVSAADAKDSLRIGFGRFTTEAEADYAAQYLIRAVRKIQEK